MKEMKYQFDYKREILDTGFCFGLLYYIISLGTHPVAYIKIPEDSKYFGKGISDIDIEVHGGITYAEDHLYISDSQKLEGYFIGWDYAHCYDINQDIARYYKISQKEAFNKSREEILEENKIEIEGDKHNSLYDAKVIKELYYILNKK